MENFKEVYKTNFAAVFAAALRFLKDYDQARDLAQDVFTDLWMHRDKYIGAENLQAYLITTTKHKAIDYYRKNV